MATDAASLGAEVVAMCRDLGFALAGVCEAAPTAHGREIIEWLEAGRHGSMEWLAMRLEERMDPRRALEGARSMVMVADLHHARPARGDAPRRDPDAMRMGRIARYAQGRDYHKVIKQRLHTLCDALREQYPQEQFRAFTDTAPVLEREHSVRAGMGWIGKHTLLIHPRLGSYMLLGGVLTTLRLTPQAEQETFNDSCGSCTRCIEACPTGAITPYSVDATKCVSYLTIERRGKIDPALHEGVGEWIYGCDVCQEVCPHNSPRHGEAAEAHPAYAPLRTHFDLLEVLGWSEDDRREAFTGSAMKRAKLEMMKRNAVIVAGNVLGLRSDPALRARLEELAQSAEESALVRETAREVLARVGL